MRRLVPLSVRHVGSLVRTPTESSSGTSAVSLATVSSSSADPGWSQWASSIERTVARRDASIRMSSVTAAASARCCLNLIAGSRPRPGTRVAAALAAGSGHVWTLLRSRTPRRRCLPEQTIVPATTPLPGLRGPAIQTRGVSRDLLQQAAFTDTRRPCTTRLAWRPAVTRSKSASNRFNSASRPTSGGAASGESDRSSGRVVAAATPSAAIVSGDGSTPHGQLAATLEELTASSVMSALPAKEFDRETMASSSAGSWRRMRSTRTWQRSISPASRFSFDFPRALRHAIAKSSYREGSSATPHRGPPEAVPPGRERGSSLSRYRLVVPWSAVGFHRVVRTRRGAGRDRDRALRSQPSPGDHARPTVSARPQT